MNSTDLPLMAAAAADCHSGGGAPLVMVVEYLETTMSRDLLCKFPDNSAFDFDYSQSTIWSPMVARPLIPVAGPGDLGSGLRRKLTYAETRTNFKEVTAKFKSKLRDAVSCSVRYQQLKKRKMRDFDFSPIPSSSKLTNTPRKGWAKVLKAASKNFKKSKKKPQIM
ncbi:uncharacterized protein LOC115996508 [Ipomoea triloba]|uniref:uncharacterized protein LOC115996508 n=1 Tax=Ipomoea triloba TaxID=35885 RepID=UPI00125D35C5|nr:uncharacterized protein LOC115996508 [Ipomoea triloba]